MKVFVNNKVNELFSKEISKKEINVRRVSPRGKYLVVDRYAALVLRAIDLFYSFQRAPKKPFSLNAAKRVLICNIAHLGDVLLSTTVIGFINKEFPHIEIGFLCSTTSKGLLNNHDGIKYLHFFDHWKLNRGQHSFFNKWKTHKTTYKKALSEITSLQYDCAVDLYPFFPNAIPLLKKAEIPHRIGYTSGGFGPLLTQSLDFQWKPQSMAFYFLDLIQLICNQVFTFENSYCLSKPSLINEKIPPTPYVIFHVGTSNPKKRWPQENWIELTKMTSEIGIKIVFTGKGKEDLRLISEIISASTVGINMCDKLTIESLKAWVFHARGVVSVDTMTAHLSSAFKVPTLVFHTGMHEKAHWAPLSSNAEVLTYSLPCSPCLKASGCLKMNCIRDIESLVVFEKMKRWFVCQ